MLQNAYFLAKIGADTAENKQHFAEICQKLAKFSNRQKLATTLPYQIFRQAGRLGPRELDVDGILEVRALRGRVLPILRVTRKGTMIKDTIE